MKVKATILPLGHTTMLKSNLLREVKIVAATQAIDGPEASERRKAEEIGKTYERGEDPQLKQK